MALSILREFKINEIVNWSTLRFAEETEAWESVERLLTGGASERDLVATKRKFQSSKDAGRVVSEICQHGYQRLLKFALAEHPSLVDFQLPQKRTLLHIAAEAGSSVAVRCLMDAKANVNARDHRGVTPLHEAAAHYSYYVLLLMLKEGADVSATDDEGYTALHYAARSGSVPAIQVLLSVGLQVDAASSSGWTPLHEAAGSSNPQCLFLLLEAGVNKLATTAAGWTALHVAARSGTNRAIRILLDAGIPVDAKTLEDETALHFAAERGAIEIVSLLAEACADLEAVDKSGRTPSRRAAERQIKEQVAAAKAVNEGAARQPSSNSDDIVCEHVESAPEGAQISVTEDSVGTEEQTTELAQEDISDSPLNVSSYDSEVSYGDDKSEYSYLSGDSYSDSDSEFDDECSVVDTASEKCKSNENLPYTPSVESESPQSNYQKHPYSHQGIFPVESESPQSNYQKHPYTHRGKYHGRGRGNFRIIKSEFEQPQDKVNHRQPMTHSRKPMSHHTQHHYERAISMGNIHQKRRPRHRQQKHGQQQHQEPHQQQSMSQQQKHQQYHHHHQQLPQQDQHKKKQYKQHHQQEGDNKPKTENKSQGIRGNTPRPGSNATQNKSFGQNRQKQGNEQTGVQQFVGLSFGMGVIQSNAYCSSTAQNRSQENTRHDSVIDELERLRKKLSSVTTGSSKNQ